MPRPPQTQVSLAKLGQLETEFTSFITATDTALDKLKALRSMIRHLRVDIESEGNTSTSWLAEFDFISNEAWTACRDLLSRVNELKQEERDQLAPLIAVVQAAREMVQADHACTLGRVGCEARWDRAIELVKQTLRGVKD